MHAAEVNLLPNQTEKIESDIYYISILDALNIEAIYNEMELHYLAKALKRGGYF